MNRMIRLIILFLLLGFFTLLNFNSLLFTRAAKAQECTESWECGRSRQGANYCCGDDAVCNDEVRPVCISGGCFLETPQKVHDDSCGGYGCSNGSCNSPPPPAQVCTPESQGAVCDTAFCSNGDVCGQGHRYCLWDGSGYGDCSEEVNNCATQCPGPVVTPPPGTPPPPPPPPPSCNNNSVQDNGETGVDCGGGNCGACPICSLNVNPASFTTGETARYTVSSSNIPAGTSLYFGGKNNGVDISEGNPISGFQANTSWFVDYGAPAGNYERYANIKWDGSWAGGQCKTTPNTPITVCGVPTPPTSINVSCANPGNTATISWSGATNASSYALRADKNPNSWNGTNANGDVIEDNITSTSYTLTTSGNSNYRVWIHSKNSCGALSSNVIETTFSCVPNCSITSNNPSSVTVNTAQVFNVTATSSTGNTQAGLQIYNASGSGVQDYAPDPKNPSLSTTTKNSSFSWTPASTGTYTVICRAWNDSIAECRGGNKKTPGVAAQYDCQGPTASKTINVVTPIIYSILGTMYVGNIGVGYTGGYTVDSAEGGDESNGNSSGQYYVNNLPFPASNNSYYQFTFSVPDGYRVTNSVLSGWSCGGSFGQGVSCPGPFLYGSILQSTLQATPSLTGVNIVLQQIPAPSITYTNSLSCISNNYPGSDIRISWNNPANIPATYIDISTDGNFTTYYHKDITGTTSTNGTGFGGFQGVTGTLTYDPGTMYYVRLWNGYNHSQTTSFTTPSFCALIAGCTATPTSINTGQSTVWAASPLPSGGSTPYTYSWSGTDSLTGAVFSITKTYYTAGDKTAELVITSADGQTVTPSCPQVTVTDTIAPWIQVWGDVHSNVRINVPGGP